MRTLFEMGISRNFWMGQEMIPPSIQAWDKAGVQYRDVIAYLASTDDPRDALGSDADQFQSVHTEAQNIYDNIADLNTAIYGAEPLTDDQQSRSQTFIQDAGILWNLIQKHPIPPELKMAPAATPQNASAATAPSPKAPVASRAPTGAPKAAPTTSKGIPPLIIGTSVLVLATAGYFLFRRG